MSRSLPTQIEDALELLLYAERYRNTLLVLILEPGLPLRSVVDALRVFELAHIRSVVFSQNYPTLGDELTTLSRRGMQLRLQPVAADANPSILIEEDTIPVFAIDTADSLSALCERSFELLTGCNAKKIFIGTYSHSLFSNLGKPLISPQELESLVGQSPAAEQHFALVSLLQAQATTHRREIVLLEGNSESLFQEVFTYLGCGTMITSSPPNRARPAELSDVLAIAQLMKPYTQEGLILHMSEDRIAQRVKEFLVYTVHEAVVGAARLTAFGTAGELGSICTLPRYRGKGLAREIAQAIFNEAKQRHLAMVFSLSTAPQMWTFFESLEMRPIDREALPEEWKAQYSFARPSRAYFKPL